MTIIEVSPLPEACQLCEERRNCIASGEGEWCCDECEHLAQRFILQVED